MKMNVNVNEKEMCEYVLGTEDWKEEGAVGCFMRVVRGGLGGFWAPEDEKEEEEEEEEDDEEGEESKVEANSFSMSLRVSSSTSLNVILGTVNLFLVAASLIAVTSTIFCKSKMSFCI
jgi:CO dehydrogenase/acetyl-CoA synthase beta subunit